MPAQCSELRLPGPTRLNAKRLRGCLSLLQHTKNAEQIRATTTTHSSINHESDDCDVIVDQQQQSPQVQLSSGGSSFSSSNIPDDEDDTSPQTALLVTLDSPTTSLHSLSDTELLRGGHLSPSHPRLQRRRSTSSLDSSPRSTYSTKRKGVKYSRDGAVVCCRFCDILRARDEDFLYEDELITVFRPLAPVVDSHILVVPRCHIRNVNMLTKDHLELLGRMKEVAALVLQQLPQTSSPELPAASSAPTLNTSSSSSDQGDDAEYKFAFHTPPFNSIDHVHMHAFRRNEGSFGCFGSIKYRTETWWCRSFQQVIARLASESGSCLRRSRRHRSKLPTQQGSSSRRTSVTSR